jgi:glycosyltransferase involved in cell wall biosynthesis
VTSPLFTVVTPSYNQGEFIERTIRSVLDQDAEGGVEYLVFDGGSTDETVAILRQHEGRLAWRSESDRGQAHAVNKGLEASRGAIIGWLNSDDVYYPGALAAVEKAFAQRPDVDVLYGEANHIDAHDAVLEPYPTAPWEFERLLSVCFICQPAAFFRRSVVDRFGALDETLRYSLDYEYWLRIALKGARFERLPVLLAGSRLHENTKTLGSRVAVHREINDMFRRTLGAVPERWISNYAHAVVDGWGIKRGRSTFAAAVSAVTLYAARRWNGGASADLWRSVRQWLAEAAVADAGRVKRRLRR